MSFSMIAAVGKRGELGKDGNLVFKIKEDMRFFKETTMGHKILMGRKTWESLPKKLPGRENIVVSRGEIAGADRTVSDLPEFIRENEESEEEIFVIGGAMIYNEFLKHARVLYLTEVAAEAEADTFFPVFDREKYQREVLGKGKENDLVYSFVKYTRK